MIITHYNLDSVDSTNSWAKRRAKFFAPEEFAVIAASEQTAGRGRFERAWHSPPEKNLYISYVFFPQTKNPAFAYSQAIGLSLCELLQARNVAVRIKWPNDIIVENKKIAGILVETAVVGEHTLVIVGIGININMHDSDFAHIDKPATSLYQQTQRAWPLEEIKQSVTDSFLNKLLQIEEGKATETAHSWLTRISWMVGTNTKVRKEESIFEGVVETIELDGSLILRTAGGEKLVIRSGEVF